MTKKKTLFKNISIFIFLVPMLVLSLLCLVPNKNLGSVNALNVAPCDTSLTTFTFIGSNINIPMSSYSYSTGSYDNTMICSVNMSFGFDGSSFWFRVNGSYMRPSSTSIRSFDSTGNFLSGDSITGSYFPLTITQDTGYYFPCYVFKPAGSTNFISSDVVRVELGYNSAWQGNSNLSCNTVTYYDSNNNYIQFTFARNYQKFSSTFGSSSDVYHTFDLNLRNYYLTLSIANNNTYYENGYTDGYNAGLSVGSENGYTDGYNAGQTIGYENGYSAGIVAGGDHTFMSLIGAVIDAPVSAFTSLLNFELLGVNILGFITGLLTLALIIFIIKLCIGGK